MACAPDMASGAFVAALRAGDAAVFVILALFATWGAYRGAVRQLLSLGVLAGAFFVAGRHGAALESTVAKLTSLGAGERAAVSWISMLFLCLVGGAIGLRFLTVRLPPRREGRGPKLLGGALGLIKGAFVVVVAAYALLAATSGDAAGAGASAGNPPSLSRTDAPAEAREPAVTWSERLRGSLAADYLGAGARTLTRWFEVPVWVQHQIEAVDRRLGDEASRRPRGP